MSTKIKITCKDENSPIDAKVAVCAKYPPYKSNIIIFHIIRDEQACEWKPWVNGDHVDVSEDNSQDIFAKFNIREDWSGRIDHYINEPQNPTDDTWTYDINYQYSIQYTGQDLDEYEWNQIFIDGFGTFTKQQFENAQGHSIEYSSNQNDSYNGPGNGHYDKMISAKIDNSLSGVIQCNTDVNIITQDH